MAGNLTTQMWTSNENLKRAFHTYTGDVMNILEVCRDDQEKISNNIFYLLFNDILSVPPSLVNGVVVGMLDSRKSVICKELRVKTGVQVSNDWLAVHAFENVRSIFKKNPNVLFIRTPLVSSLYRTKQNEELIQKFKPVIHEILVTILQTQIGCHLIPILCLGLNSAQAIQTIISSKFSPRYVIITSYHPKYILEMRKLADKYPKGRTEYLKLIDNASKLIEDSVKVFFGVIT